MPRSADLALLVDARRHELGAGSLLLFGEPFGRPFDNIHTLVHTEANPDADSVTLVFDAGETLQIWNPEEVVIDAEGLRIGRASRLRWEWTPYGEDDGSRCVIEHAVVDDALVITTDQPPTTRRTAVEHANPAVLFRSPRAALCEAHPPR